MIKRIGLDITVLNDAQKTGVGVYTYELIKALLNLNKKDQFILFGFATLKTFDYLKNIEFKKYPNVTLKILKIPAKLFRLTFLTWQKINLPGIEQFIGGVDLFHSFNFYLPPQKGGKVVATVFDLTSLINEQWHLPKTTQLDKLRLDRIAKMADLVITISQNSKKDLLNFHPNLKVEVIYPAAKDIFFKKLSSEQINKVLKKYNLSAGYILSVATLEPRKNLSNLIEAYLKLNSDRLLVLVGARGWKSNQVLKLANQFADKIKLTNFIASDDLPALYQGAACLIYPSLYEGFGLPILEAMASGTAVVTSNVSSLPEAGGEAAIYVDPDNLDDIVKALEKVTTDVNFRKKIISLGFEQVKKFSWHGGAEKLNHLYQRLCT